jgi:hypothetical protein
MYVKLLSVFMILKSYYSPTVHDSVISYHDAKVTSACGADYKLCCTVLRNLIMHAAVFQREEKQKQ